MTTERSPDDVEVEWRTSDASIAMPIGQPPANQRTTRRGVLALGAPGRVAIEAAAGGATAEMTLDVQPNPAARITLTPDRSAVRTGDVTRLTATVSDADGRSIDDIPVAFSVSRDHGRDGQRRPVVGPDHAGTGASSPICRVPIPSWPAPAG